MSTFEEQRCEAIFSSEAPDIVNGLSKLAQAKAYEIETAGTGWRTGESVTLRRGQRWLSVASRTPEQLGSFQKLVGARGFKINTSWGHEVLLYRDMNGWHTWNPTLITTGSIDVEDASEWLETQLTAILD